MSTDVRLSGARSLAVTVLHVFFFLFCVCVLRRFFQEFRA